MKSIKDKVIKRIMISKINSLVKQKKSRKPIIDKKVLI